MTGMAALPFRIGVVGCGTIAYWTHLRELTHLRGVRLVAAADPEPAARGRASKLARIPVYASAEELLRRTDVDAVVICAPTGLHAPLAIAAAEAGKHFYLEKPVATHDDEARRVVEAAKKAGVVAAMGFNRRFHPALARARQLLAGGTIGRVLSVQTVFCEPAAPEASEGWRRTRASGGGVLLDLASHHIDLVRWMLGDEVTVVEARIESRRSEQDCAWLRLSLRGGAEVAGFFSFCAGRTDTLEFTGGHGVLRVDRFRTVPEVRLSRRLGYGVRSALIVPDAAALAWGLRRIIRPSWESSYRRALGAFADKVRGRLGPLATLEDGRRALQIVLAAEESAATGASVLLSDGPD